MASPRRHARSSSGSSSLVAASAFALLALGAASTAAPAHSSKKGTSAKCAAEFEGCTKCKTIDSVYSCTKCRSFSTWSDDDSACVCNTDDGYGTISKDLFDIWAAGYCTGGGARKSSKHCKRPKYSSVAGKCVQCDKYVADETLESVNGVCSPPLGAVLDTKLTLFNDIPNPDPDTDWNPSWLKVNMGQCSVGCNLDPTYLLARTLKPGESTSQQGRNTAQSADITADITFCKEWSGLIGCSSGQDVVRVESGNPTFGYPWISIGGNEHSFYENEEWTTTVNGHTFKARRNNDLGAAKDMIVRVVT